MVLGLPQSRQRLQSKDEHDRAIKDYDQAIKLDPSDARPFCARGGAYPYKGEYDRAIKDYDQAIRLNPKYAFAFFNRGPAYTTKASTNAPSRTTVRRSSSIRTSP